MKSIFRLILGLIAVGLTAVDASAQQTAKNAFKPARLERAFRQSSEREREHELAIAAASVRQPELPATLARVIELDLKRKRLQRSTLLATELFCSLESDGLLEQQLEFGKSPITPVAVVASSTLADRKEPAALDALCELTKRDEYSQSFGIRRSILDGVANYKQPQAIDFIIAAHEQHPGQLRYEATKHLMRMTGENHGGYTNRWQSWWKTQRDDFDFDSVVALYNVKDMPWPNQVPRLFDVPIHAYRVMFVVDRSKSMLSTKGDETRMEMVQKEFERVLKTLRPECWFNVISYSKGLKLWKKKLVPASPANRLAATQHVWSMRPDTTTSFYDAVDRAMKDAKDLELIVVLSDGKPTTGKVIDQDRIVQLITKKNKFHEVSIIALGLDLAGQQRDFLTKLTDNNFGELWEIR
jgi:hypothetical protein